MKKLLSVIVMVAMLVTAMCPAFAVAAADTGLQVSVESTPFEKNAEGFGQSTVTITVTNNPGFSALSIMSYFDNDVVSIADYDVTTSAFGEDYVAVGSAKRSTLAAQKKFYTAAGVATAANIYGSMIDVASDDADGLNTVVVGEVVKLIVTTNAALDELGKDFTTDIGFFVIDDNSSDENGDPLAEYFAPFTTTLAPDPFAPFADAKSFENFTVSVDSMNVYKGTTEVSVGLRYYGSEFTDDGINGTRFYIVYPKVEGLTLTSVTNGSLYASSETFWQGLAYDPNAYYDANAEDPFANVDPDMINAFNDTSDGISYNVYDWIGQDVLVFRMLANLDDPYANIKEDGLIVNLNFTIDENVRVGTTYEIGVYEYYKDTIWAPADDGTGAAPVFKQVPMAVDNGGIKILSRGGECEHASTVEEIVTPATCTSEGSKNIICAECGEIVDTVVIPTTEHNIVVVPGTPATCTSTGLTDGKKCDVCDTEIEAQQTIAMLDHTPGEKVVTSQPTHETEGAWEIKCTECDTVIENGVIAKLVNASFSAGDAGLKPGDSIAVPVSVTDNPGFFIARLQFKYDPAKFVYVGTTAGVLVPSDNVIINDDGNGTVTLYFEALDDADVMGDGSLVCLNFKAMDDEAIVGESAFELVIEEVINYAGQDIECTATNGTATLYPNTVIAAGTATVEALKSVEVPVGITTNWGFWATRLEIAYDANALTLDAIKSGLLDIAEGVNYSVKDGVITIFADADTMENIAVDGTLFTLVFTANVAGDYAIDVTILEAINVDGYDVDMKAADGMVTVTPYAEVILGDAEVKAAADATVTVPVSVANNKGIVALGMEVKYDAAALTFKGITSGIFAVDEFSASAADGVITIYVESADVVDVAENRVLFNIEFAVAATAAGEYELDAAIIPGNTINAAGEEVEFVVTDATITVAAHDCVPVVDAAVPATCTSTGLTEGSHCEICGEILVAQEVVEMLEHTSDEGVTTAPTETEEGSIVYSCTECGTVIKTETIPALGAYIVRVSAAANIVDIAYADNNVAITAFANAESARFAVKYGEAVASIASDNCLVVDKGTFAYITVSADSTFVITDTYGNTKTYTVTYATAESVDLALTKVSATENIHTINVADKAITVVSNVAAETIKFAVKFDANVTSVVANNADASVFYAGGFAYVTVAKGAEDVTLVIADDLGNSATYTVDVTFSEPVALDAIHKASKTENLKSITLDAVNANISFETVAGADYAKFAIGFTSDIVRVEVTNAEKYVWYPGDWAYITVANGASDVTISLYDEMGNVCTYTVTGTFVEAGAGPEITKASAYMNSNAATFDAEANTITVTRLSAEKSVKFAIKYDTAKTVKGVGCVVNQNAGFSYVTLDAGVTTAQITLTDAAGNSSVYTINIVD